MSAKHTYLNYRRGFVLSLFVCFVISTCTSTGVVLARTADGGTEPAFVAKLRPVLLAEMQRMHVPGAIIYINDPAQGFWTATLGTSNLATGAPMQVNSFMRIGSITKTLTATVILQLVDEGKLRLEDPVGKYQPEVPNGGNITIRELLNMSSGLFNYTEDKGLNQTFDNDPGKVFSPDELIAIGFQHPPYFAPGKGYHYSNTNYVLLGMIIEQLTGMKVEDVFQQRIFQPLGMNSSSLPKRASAVIPDPHPQGYMFGTNVQGLEAPPLTPEQAARVDAAAGTPNNVTTMNPSWAWTAGSAISTLGDLQIWAQALATGKLLSAATQQERLSWITVAPGLKYGLGIAEFNGFIGHNGQIPGYQSFMAYQPQKGATIIVLTNLFASPSGTEPADLLARVIMKEVFA